MAIYKFDFDSSDSPEHPVLSFDISADGVFALRIDVNALQEKVDSSEDQTPLGVFMEEALDVARSQVRAAMAAALKDHPETADMNEDDLKVELDLTQEEEGLTLEELLDGGKSVQLAVVLYHNIKVDEEMDGVISEQRAQKTVDAMKEAFFSALSNVEFENLIPDSNSVNFTPYVIEVI